MDCRQCNWYQCGDCHRGDTRSDTCPGGHRLVAYTSPGGVCDGPCGRQIRSGERVMDCRQCNWYQCGDCRTRAGSSRCAPALRPVGDTADTGFCPEGHRLVAYTSPGGACDGPCGRQIRRGERVMDCRQCNWYQCGDCRGDCRGDTFGMQDVAVSLPQAQKTLKFYHGTSWNRACEIGKSGFIPSESGCLGRGIYVAREDKARRFALSSSRHGGDGGSGLIEVVITFTPNIPLETTRRGSAKGTTHAVPTTRALRPTWSGASRTRAR